MPLHPPLDIPSPPPCLLPPPRTYDAVIVGAGVAGLTLALSLPAGWRVALLTKGNLGESNTRWAQGGISAALGPDDSPDLHEVDTLAAGAGLCDPAAVHVLVNGAADAVDWLVSIGAEFDRDEASGDIHLGREAAHSRRRVLHAGGDATGAEVERALVAKVRTRPNVEVHEGAFAVDLVVESHPDEAYTDASGPDADHPTADHPAAVRQDRCVGLIAVLAGELVHLSTPVVALAAGGAGQLWATTSNPPAATADGLAIALRAGVAVADLEFVQFHPTVLALPWSAPFLISEAVRGEGAYLRDQRGERFMVGQHPLAELAPRDVVARGIQSQLLEHGPNSAFLDLRHLDPAAMRARFPTIAAQLADRGIDLTTDLVPVAPAAHYFMGGVVAGTDGRTSLPGLLAVGEAACTGVHGANRLASNSLLEGLVFGRLAASRAVETYPPSLSTPAPSPSTSVMSSEAETSPPSTPDAPDADVATDDSRAALRDTMSRHVSVVRDAPGLATAVETLTALSATLNAQRSTPNAHLPALETANMLLAAHAIATAALLREESRGAHHRADFPATDPALDARHLVHHPSRGGWTLTSLSDALSPST